MNDKRQREKPQKQTVPGSKATDAPRIDRVELHAGIVHLPAEVREVARLANQAGLEGYRFVNADFGMHTDLDDPELLWTSHVELTYELLVGVGVCTGSVNDTRPPDTEPGTGSQASGGLSYD